MINQYIDYWARLINESTVDKAFESENDKTINLPEDVCGALRLSDLKCFGDEDMLNAILYTLTQGNGVFYLDNALKTRWGKSLTTLTRDALKRIVSWLNGIDDKEILRSVLNNVTEEVSVKHGLVNMFK